MNDTTRAALGRPTHHSWSAAGALVLGRTRYVESTRLRCGRPDRLPGHLHALLCEVVRRLHLDLGVAYRNMPTGSSGRTPRCRRRDRGNQRRCLLDGLLATGATLSIQPVRWVQPGKAAGST